MAAIKPQNSAETISIMEKEKGLARQLSTRQITMIAIGGAIGTGLFLGSSLAVRVAGPAVILTYLVGAFIALLLMGALAEMAVAHPTAGSFGVYAEVYVSKWAGFVVRYTYWAVQSIAIGGEAVAAAVYCQFWFPHVPPWLWVIGFSLGLIYVNARSVGNFGEFEYWFAMIKVVAIILFIVFGIAAIMGLGSAPAIGLKNFTEHGGFFPTGVKGAWAALVFVIFSYIGAEVVAVTAGEAKEPQKAVPRAMRSMIGRLIIFYVGAIVILIGVVPWNQIQTSTEITASPFVTVFAMMGIKGATHIMNFVVLTAALSSMNCNLYLGTRMMFSLSRGGYAPAMFGEVSKRGVPLKALLVSAFGLMIATMMAYLFNNSAYVYMFAVALFGGLLGWLLIFLTHLFFRRKWITSGARLPVTMIRYPYTSAIGLVLILAILITTWWVEGMAITLIAGLPWLAFISLMYLLWARRQPAAASVKTEQTESA